MHKFGFLSFFSIFSLVYFGGHYYVYTRLVNGICLATAARYSIFAFFFLSSMSFYLTRIFAHSVVAQNFHMAAYFGNVWVGIVSISVAIFFIRDILMIFFRGDNFLYYSAIFSIVAAGLLSLYSFYNVHRGPVVREIKIKTEKLPGGINSFSIVQLSDLHLDFLSSREWVEKIVEQTNALNPDIIVVTGDLIERGIDHRDDFAVKFRKLSSRFGVFAILGNHEYYVGVNTFFRFAGQSNMRILRNEKITISGFLELIGLDDKTGKIPGEFISGIENVFKTADDKKLVVVLGHRPDFYKYISKFGIDFYLSGHTHAGQIPPMDLIVKLYYKHPYGFYPEVNPKNGKKSFIYTTSGTGTWAPPLRLFSKSEIVKIVFEK
ncbi:MAG: metallophosphoesterase [bacterium]